jgi:hypothetical protein
MLRFGFILILLDGAFSLDNKFKGCYKTSYLAQNASQLTTIDTCVDECKLKYYRYAMVHYDIFCQCSNFLGEEVNNTMLCKEFCLDCDFKANLTDVYLTGNLGKILSIKSPTNYGA